MSEASEERSDAGDERLREEQMTGVSEHRSLAGLLAAFAALTVAVVLAPDNALDRAVMRFDAAHPWPPAVAVANVVIGLGTPLLVGLVTLTVVLWRDRRRLADPLIRLLLMAVAVLVLKNSIGRAGPPLEVTGRNPILGLFENAVHPISGAFPSGHTATSVVCLWLILRPATRLAWSAYLAWVAVLSASLVYENFHWLTDVTASWLLGAAILTVPVTRRRRTAPQRAESSPCPVSIPPSRGG